MISPWFQRYRPYVVAVIAVLVIAFLPTRGDEGDTSGLGDQVATDVRGPVDAGKLSGVAASDDAAAMDGAPPAATSPAAGDPSAGQVDVRESPAPTSPGAGEAAAHYPGINTEAALRAPDCDPATKRIKIVSWFAPPCVAPWPADGDNGGATSPGVTSEKIRIVHYYHSNTSNQSEDDYRQAWADVLPIYERFWRTWGREVEVTMFTTTGSDEVAQRADAIKIADLKPFAMYVYAGDTYRPLIAELAARGIITITESIDAKTPLAHPGFIFSNLLPPGELTMEHAVEYVGKRLVGRPARWAGDPVYQTQPRTFGVTYPDSWDIEAFKRKFSQYGGSVQDAIGFTQNYDSATYQERARLMVARFKEKGVNSLINGGDIIFNVFLTKEATNQNWFPEWVLMGTAACVDPLARLADPLQMENAFGLCEFPLVVTEPTKTTTYFDWYYGEQAGNRNDTMLWSTYALFGGIHLAGPRLTPETFKDALFALPPSGGSACNCVHSNQLSWGNWGFAPWADYNGYDDFADVWWDAQYIGPDNADPTGIEAASTPGHFRYMNEGRRFTLGQWPADEPAAFDPQAATDPPRDYPDREVPPQYPCDGCPSQG